ncbi:MAG: hypothetical protein KC635_15965 [Myxococcales bacterium]|nr:hypothetical protein [Myxococcales bacterium]MCB9736646.1 hypothetical protein [Deltaproteobacteria bacterium]
MPTSSHIFYIPIVFVLGLILGVVLGRRSALVQIEEEKRLAQRKAARKSGAASADTAGAPADEPGEAKTP